MFKDLVDRLKEGIHVNGYIVRAKNIKDGRIKGQRYFDIWLVKQAQKKRLMRISLYKGKEPHYRPWVEMFSIKPTLKVDGEIEYFGSEIEKRLLDIFASSMDRAGRIFIEYQSDRTTAEELSRGVPESCSRLGYELFERDFTWFKDWYFAEGFNEGAQKLQAEKPVDEEHHRKHLEAIEQEIEGFLEEESLEGAEEAHVRARSMLEEMTE